MPSWSAEGGGRRSAALMRRPPSVRVLKHRPLPCRPWFACLNAFNVARRQWWSCWYVSCGAQRPPELGRLVVSAHCKYVCCPQERVLGALWLLVSVPDNANRVIQAGGVELLADVLHLRLPPYGRAIHATIGTLFFLCKASETVDVRESVVTLGCVDSLTRIAKHRSMATHARVMASDFLHDLSESRPGQVRVCLCRIGVVVWRWELSVVPCPGQVRQHASATPVLHGQDRNVVRFSHVVRP